MSEKFFGQPMNPKEHIEQELDDAGISHPSEWREAVHFEDEKGEESVVEKTESMESIRTGEINNENWQRQLDTAFEQNDYELIKTLRKVRPQSAPRAELIEVRMRELITTRPNQWVETFGKIKSISSDVELDQTLVAGEFGKLFEKFAQEKGIAEQLKEFKRATGYAPSPEVVQAKYRSIFSGKKHYNFDTEDLIKDIKGLTGTQPDKEIFQEIVDTGDILQAKKIAQFFGVEITSEMIQRSYEVQFEKNGYLGTHYISGIGEKPNQALVERAYQRIIEKRGERWIDSIKSLEQATGIKPVFTEEQMRPIFEEFLQRGWYGQKGYVGIDHLTEMTGMKPPVDLVEKTALKIVDGGHGYIDQGKGIKEGLMRLEESVGVAFEIPESEIQERYQKAIADKKAHVISNLYGGLGIRPKIDKEEARQFMVTLMDYTYHDFISELEKVFGVKFKATKEEIVAKQDQNLEKSNFNGLVKIKELTGQDCDPKKVEATLIQLLEKEATIPSEKRGDYGSDWEKGIKQRLEQFNITIPPEVAINIYAGLIQNETAHSDNLKKVSQITGVPIPENLAQQAYQKYLSSEYAYSIKTGQGSSRGLGSVSSAFEELYKISAIKPEIPFEQLQSFYRNSLEEDSRYGRGLHNIKKIAEITGIKPEFDSNDINQLYKQWVLSGREDLIRNVKDVTGIELQLDQEISLYVSQQIEAGIEKVRSGDYEKEKSYSKDKEFDSSALEQDLRKVSSLATYTGVKPDLERLQIVYAGILSSDPYWNAKIEQITKATGIQPTFTAEMLQAKGQELLENGELRSFERLQKYGDFAFTFTPEITEKTYKALQQKSEEWERKMRDQGELYDNDGNTWNYYTKNFADRLSELQKMSGVRVDGEILAQVFLRNMQSNKRSYNKAEDAVDFLKEKFDVDMGKALSLNIYKVLFVSGDFESIDKLKKKTGLAPEVPTEIVREKCDDLLQKRDLQTLKTLKTTLGLETLPLSPEVVQGEYTKLVENPKFATYNDKDIEIFYTLFELTGIRPELSSEQTAMAYRRVMFASYDGGYEKFERVIGVPPTESDLQNRIYNWLVEDYMRKDNVTKFMEKYKVAVSPEIANKAAIRRLEKTGMGKFLETIKTVKLIEEISGLPVLLEVSVVENATQKILESHKATEYSCTELDDLFSWFEESTGQKPSQRLVDLAYTRTLGQTISYEETPDGKNLQAWDWLKQKYGLPSPKAVQSIYLAQLLPK